MGAYFLKGEEDLTFTDLSSMSINVYSVNGLLDEEPKAGYSYDWADEDGIEVYIPEERTVKALEVEMWAYILGSNAVNTLNTFKTFLKTKGILTYYDTIRNRECQLRYDKLTVEVDRFRSGSQFIQFKVIFTNIDGITNTHTS